MLEILIIELIVEASITWSSINVNRHVYIYIFQTVAHEIRSNSNEIRINPIVS